jgi:hypothetical protein
MTLNKLRAALLLPWALIAPGSFPGLASANPLTT